MAHKGEEALRFRKEDLVVLATLAELLFPVNEQRNAEVSGHAIWKKAGLGRPIVYAALERLERAGKIRGRWDVEDETMIKGNRLYRLEIEIDP